MTILLLSHDIYSIESIDRAIAGLGVDVRHETGKSLLSSSMLAEKALDDLLNHILILSAQDKLS